MAQKKKDAKAPENATEMQKYLITTKTGDGYKVGNTDADVYIQMIGDEGRLVTSWMLLDNKLRDDFERGKTDKFNIKAENVGLPEVIRLKIDKKKEKLGWLCETVTVQFKNEEEKVLFLVHDWVTDELAVRTGKASLPQHESWQLLQDIRRFEADQSKSIYKWHLTPTEAVDEGWKLPRYCSSETYEELPLMFQNNDATYEAFVNRRHVALVNILMEFTKSIFKASKIEKFDDYLKIFRHHSLPSDLPRFYKCWSTDEEFGRQMVDGVNTLPLHRLKEIPEGFEKAEKEIFCNDTTFGKEIEAKRLYCFNYRGFATDVKRNKNKAGKQLYCADPICLLQVGLDRKLRPIAIQLEEDGHIFTPKDSEHDWLLAKMYFRNTDLNMHEWRYHYVGTHLIMEVHTIAMFRNLSRHHPIYKLLRPHVHTIPGVNTMGRMFMTGPKSAVNLNLSLDSMGLSRRAFEAFDYSLLVVPELIKEQGTDDREALPCYHYRDDVLLLWDAIEKYVSGVVKNYYKSDEDVCEDYELSGFVLSVVEEGIEWAGQGPKGFPKKLHTVDELIRYATVVVFTCSVQHAATNFGQLETYKYIPNAPAGMRLPPHKKGEATMKRILDTLPDPIMACLQVGTGFTLSSYSPNEIYLGDFPMGLFQDDKDVMRMQHEFRQDLNRITAKINQRNESLKIPYIYLLPESIPISTAA